MSQSRSIVAVCTLVLFAGSAGGVACFPASPGATPGVDGGSRTTDGGSGGHDAGHTTGSGCVTAADCPAASFAGVSEVECDEGECVYPGAFCDAGTITAPSCVCPAHSACTSAGCICNSGYQTTLCNGTPCTGSACNPTFECSATTRDGGASDGGATFACGAGACPADGRHTCVSGQCEIDLVWSQWPAPPDAPPTTNYTVANGTVTDGVTGLVWQQTVSPTLYDYTDAETYCQSLNVAPGLGGYTSGWRVPEIIELVSILNLGNTDSSIDETAFPGTPVGWFWANTHSTFAEAYFWTITYGTGDTSDIYAGGNPYSVRCVRSSVGESIPATATPLTSAPPGRYVITGDGTAQGTVYDVITQLTWQQASSASTYTWSSTGAAGSGQAYCASLDATALGGFTSGWRLPTVKELESIVNFRVELPSVDGAAFPMTQASNFLTTTPYVFDDNTSNSWGVGFNNGITDGLLLGASNLVRCVH